MGLTKKSRDFLDKELFVERNIVTFRSLSRELRIHVNDAKKELQLYYDAVHDTNASAVPTYLISGEVPSLKASPPPKTQHSDSAMDLDLEFEEDQEEMDVVHQTRVLLVDARSLDEVMSQFSRIHSVHIYSLSPSRFGDAGLVCIPSSKVRKADTQGGLASFSVTGKITGSHVKLNSGAVHKSAASSSKTTLDASTKAAPRAVAPTGAEQQSTKGKASSSETKQQVPTTTTLPKAESKDGPKHLGKLDWSKAKTKNKEPVAGKTNEDKKPKLEPDSTVTTKSSLVSKKLGPEPTEPLVPKSESGSVVRDDVRKRGIKRKPHIDTDEESESELSVKAEPSAGTGSHVKKETVFSDEDEDEDDDGAVRMLGLRRPKRKGTVTSDSEASLRAMMDIDDELVDRVRVSRVRPQSEGSEEEAETETIVPPATSEDEESDDEPIVPKKRKPRKVVPVGHNGLRKRRVVKSRMTTDAKGYMQTEDYSSYESVEEEEEAETKPKGKGKAPKKAEPKVKAESKAVIKEESTSAAKSKAKSTPKSRGGAPKRGGLLNFFGPEKGKK